MNSLTRQIFRKIEPVNQFVSTWNTVNISSGSSTSNQLKLPLLNNGNYNFKVNWGDGLTSNITSYNQAEILHTYASSGIYTITITGICDGWSFYNSGDKFKIVSVLQWGILKLGKLIGNFYGCKYLDLSIVSDVLNLTGITALDLLFMDCKALTTIAKLDEWDFTTVKTMEAIFATYQ